MYDFSPQEAKILALATQGYADKEIAQELGISFDTVRTYWGRIKAKTGGGNRTELVAQFLQAKADQRSENDQGQIHALNLEVEKRITEEAKVRSILDSLPVGAMISSPDEGRFYVNEAWTSIVGIHREEALNYHWVERVHVDDREYVTDRLFEGIARHEPFEIEYRYIRPDGQTRQIVSRGVPLGSCDDRQGFVGIVEDVTLLREAQKRAELLMLAEQTSGFGSFAYDWGDGNLIWSPGLYSLFDLPLDSPPLSIERFLELVHPGDRREVDLFLEQNQTASGRATIRYRIVTEKGHEKSLVSTVMHHTASDGRKKMVGTLRDVSKDA